MEVKQQFKFIPFTFIYCNCYGKNWKSLSQTFLIDIVATGLSCYQNEFIINIFSKKNLQLSGQAPAPKEAIRH